MHLITKVSSEKTQGSPLPAYGIEVPVPRKCAQITLAQIRSGAGGSAKVGSRSLKIVQATGGSFSAVCIDAEIFLPKIR